MSEKEDIKKKIRALLISSQSGVPLFNFLKDYYDIIGEPLKFRDLGYFDLEDFLMDMPDVVSVVKAADGQTVLKHVSDNSTKHIEKLVARQKASVTKKTRASNNSFNKTNRYFQPSSITPSYSSSLPSRSPASPSSYRPRPINKQFRPISLPNFIKRQIQQTLAGFSEPISSYAFDAAYKARFGASLNYEKCGFCSLDAVLQSIPDIVMGLLQRNGQYYYKILKPACNGDYRNGSSCSSNNYSSFPSNSYQAQLPGHSEYKTPLRPVPLLQLPTSYSGMRSQPFYAPFGSDNSQTGYNHSNTSFYDDRIPRANRKFYGRDSNYSTVADLGKNNNSFESLNTYDNQINPKIASNIMRVLKSHQEGLYSSKLCSAYKDYHGIQLDYRDMGFLSVIDLVSKLDTVQIVRPSGSGDWILFDNKRSKETVEKLADQLIALELGKGKIMKEREKQVRLNISKMMESFLDGVTLDCFMEKYKASIGSTFKPSDVGFKSLESYLLSLADNIIDIKYSGNACLTIKSAKKIKSPERLEPTMNPPQSLPISSIPEDAVGPGVAYRLLDIPNNVHFVEVFVSNIETPGHFWLKFRGKAYSIALENLMDELELLYYSSETDAYHVPDDFIQVGLVAAAIYPEDQNWHRVSITRVTNVSCVEVYFVDYGNSCTVSRKSLRLLRNSFLSLPMQAIEGRLANIKPVNDKWSTKARNRMLSLCLNKPLVALVTQVKDRVMSVCLTDTSDEKIDVHINDVLVAESYCIFYPDDNDIETNRCSLPEGIHPPNANLGCRLDAVLPQLTPEWFLHAVYLKSLVVLFQNASKPEISDPSQENISEITKDSLDKSVLKAPRLLQQSNNDCNETTLRRTTSSKSVTCEDKINGESPKKQSYDKLRPVNRSSKCEGVVRPTSISNMPITDSLCKFPMNSGNAFSNNIHTSDISKDFPVSQGNDLKPFVQRLELTSEITIHLFNYNGTPCISSCELSSFFWKIDIIRTMLRRINLGISKVIICEEDYEELFKVLENINFSGLKFGEEHKDWLTLFRLVDVPMVLEAFSHPSVELKAAINKAILEFDPEDLFWKINNNLRRTVKKVLENPPVCRVEYTSPVPIPANNVSNGIQHLSVRNKEQLNLSRSSSPPNLRSQWRSPQDIKFKASSLETMPWLHHSSASGEDMKTINYNLTVFHKQRQRILNRLMVNPNDYENSVKELEEVEDKLQKLNELLIKISPTVESRDLPGRSHSPYQNQSNYSGSPSSSRVFSPRESYSVSRSSSSSPVPENVPLNPKTLHRVLDSQHAAMLAASNEHFLTAGLNSSGIGNHSSQLSETSYKLNRSPTARNNSNKHSPLLLPNLYPLLREQIASTSCIKHDNYLLGGTRPSRSFNPTSPSLSPKHMPFKSLLH